jgi:hypothetical protein
MTRLLVSLPVWPLQAIINTNSTDEADLAPR